MKQLLQEREFKTGMVGMDQYMSDLFPAPPLTAFKRPKNIKVPEVPGLNNRPKRKVNGMSKCNKPCQASPYILEEKEVKVNYKATRKIIKPVNCNYENCVYMIECNKQNCGKICTLEKLKEALQHVFQNIKDTFLVYFQLKLLESILTNQDRA